MDIYGPSVRSNEWYHCRTFLGCNLPGPNGINDCSQCVNSIISTFHFRQINPHRTIFRKKAFKKKLEHLRITGLGPLDPFAHKFEFFALKQRFGHLCSCIF